MPKISKRTPRQGGYLDHARKDPGHPGNQPHVARHATKDTKRWCKGKVGRPHNYEVVTHFRGSWFSFDIWTCTACGKRDHRGTAKPQP